jgi:single-strand DNA-binding protein
MASFNRVILAGNLTRDPQLSYLPSNTAVCDFGLAMNRKFRDKDGNQKEEVCYVDLQAWGRTAETINQYFQKGKPILVEGRLRYREWTSKEGQKRSKLEVSVDTFSFIDGGAGGAGGGGGGAGGGGGGYRGQAGGGGHYQGRPGPGSPAPSEPQGEPEPPPMDDGPPPGDPDIPF